MLRAVLRRTGGLARATWQEICRDNSGSVAMNLQGQERLGRTHLAGLAGLGAIALVLVINVGIGKLPVRNPISGSQLASSEIFTPAISTTAEAPVDDSNAGLSKRAETRPKITLSRDQVWEVQAWLRAFNHDPGTIDGIPGPRTFDAVKRFEAAHQRPETGNLNYALLGALRLASGQPLR